MSISFEHIIYQFRGILLSCSFKKWSKMIIWVALMLIWFNSLCHWFTCSASSSNSYLITSDQCSFTGFTTTKTWSVISSPVSNSLYYSYSLYLSSYVTAIRKINQDGSLAWMAALSFNPIMKSLAVDALELYAYVSYLNYPLIVVRLEASTGSIVDSQSQ